MEKARWSFNQEKHMARTLMGTLGMGGGFLFLSAALRSQAMHVFEAFVALLQQHSPYSYILLGLVFFGGAAASFKPSPHPH
jgi:hypothetical protein